ncbi:hypothetical protein Tco_1066499 [Tanacetum coccineum]|uniref:Uncharacterized protein n=1 Tax=Tanacetum coccineum TaxID=301880 RepID=A0ABQ5HA78_9ASTR
MFVKVILWNAEERDVVPPGCSIHTVIIDPHGIRANDDSKYPMQDMLISLLTYLKKSRKFAFKASAQSLKNQCLLQMLNVMEIRRRYIIKAFQIPTDMSIEVNLKQVKDQDQVITSSSEDHDQGKSKEVGTLRYLSLVVPLTKVGDEAVHKELGDRMERIATTASSLEAEQDSDAQTRFEAASKSPMIHLSQEVTHLEVGRTVCNKWN